MSASTPSTWLRTAGDAVTLKPEPFQRFGWQSSIRLAVGLVVVVGLIIGLVNALIGVPALVRGDVFDPEAFLTELEQGFGMSQMFGGQQPETEAILDQIKQGFEAFAPYIQRIEAIETPLPPFFGRLFAWLGAWLSTPFGLLAKWLSISIWIMLFARLLGGKGGLVSYLSASSLSVLPHLLSAFGFIPCLGGALALVGSIWGLIIQMKAVQTTHGLSQGRSVAAVLLPYLLLILLILLLSILFSILIAVSANSASQ